MIFTRVSLPSVTLLVLLAFGLCIPLAAQSDLPRQTVAITYPLDETVNVKFRGTTLLPRLKGEAKVKRAGRRGTRVELSIDNLNTRIGAGWDLHDLCSLGHRSRRTRR